MTGYCRICHLRIESGHVRMVGLGERGRAEYVALGGHTMAHIQNSHPEVFQSLMLLSIKLQSVMSGYLLESVPAVPGEVQTVSLEAERAALKAELSALLALDNPVEVKQVEPAAPVQKGV